MRPVFVLLVVVVLLCVLHQVRGQADNGTETEDSDKLNKKLQKKTQKKKLTKGKGADGATGDGEG